MNQEFKGPFLARTKSKNMIAYMALVRASQNCEKLHYMKKKKGEEQIGLQKDYLVRLRRQKRTCKLFILQNDVSIAQSYCIIIYHGWEFERAYQRAMQEKLSAQLTYYRVLHLQESLYNYSSNINCFVQFALHFDNYGPHHKWRLGISC